MSGTDTPLQAPKNWITAPRREDPLTMLQGYYRIMGARATPTAPLIAQVPDSGLIMLYPPSILRALEKRTAPPPPPQ